jgi:Tfp pilus assembly protein PilF
MLTTAGCRSTSPIDAVRLNQEAQVYLEHGDVATAQERLEQSLNADHENPATHYWLGHVHELQDDVGKAEYHYRLAIRFTPATDAAHEALIRLLHKQGKTDASVQATRVFLAQKTNVRASELMQLASVLAAEKMDHQAIMIYKQAQKVEELNPEPSLALAEFYFARDRQEEGVSALTHAFMIDPQYPELARRLGELGQRVGVPEPELFQETSPIKRELYGLD